MSTRHQDLTRHVDEARVRAALDSAERGTSGVIHVTIAKNIRGGIRGAAERAFRHLGFAAEDAKAVLFFVVPARREFAVLGSEAIHRRVGDAFWTQLVQDVGARASETDLTTALVQGIDAVGAQLALHFSSGGAAR